MSTITVDEIARVAGVSKSTVSRVINQSPRVAPDMVRSVQEAMSRLGYFPSNRRPGPKPAARKGVRTGNLLLLFLGQRISSANSLPGSPELLRGIEMAIEEHGMKLMLAGFDGEGALPTALAPREVDGAIIFGKSSALTPTIAERLAAMPTVALLRGSEALPSPVDEVTYDNAAVGPMAAKYLVDRGHKSLGFFNSNFRHPPFVQRQRDFTSSASAAGASVASFVSDEDSPNEGYEHSSTRALVDRMLSLPKAQRPTALFVVADPQLPSLYHVLEDRGVRPGRDLEIISCDNARPYLNQLAHRPATIDINLELVGARAVQQLLWRMANPEAKNRIRVIIQPLFIEAAETPTQTRA